MNMLIDITIFQNLVYIVSSVLFILGIKMLGKESTAVRGNILSSVAMLSAVSVTLIDVDIGITIIISAIILGALIGSVIALKVKMTAIPEMVALFNGFGGMASFLIAWSQFTDTQPALLQNLLIMITIYIGGITFSGSIVAYGKLSEKNPKRVKKMFPLLIRSIVRTSQHLVHDGCSFCDIFFVSYLWISRLLDFPDFQTPAPD